MRARRYTCGPLAPETVAHGKVGTRSFNLRRAIHDVVLTHARRASLRSHGFLTVSPRLINPSSRDKKQGKSMKACRYFNPDCHLAGP